MQGGVPGRDQRKVGAGMVGTPSPHVPPGGSPTLGCGLSLSDADRAWCEQGELHAASLHPLRKREMLIPVPMVQSLLGEAVQHHEEKRIMGGARAMARREDLGPRIAPLGATARPSARCILRGAERPAWDCLTRAFNRLLRRGAETHRSACISMRAFGQAPSCSAPIASVPREPEPGRLPTPSGSIFVISMHWA